MIENYYCKYDKCFSDYEMFYFLNRNKELLLKVYSKIEIDEKISIIARRLKHSLIKRKDNLLVVDLLAYKKYVEMLKVCTKADTKRFLMKANQYIAFRLGDYHKYTKITNQGLQENIFKNNIKTLYSFAVYCENSFDARIILEAINWINKAIEICPAANSWYCFLIRKKEELNNKLNLVKTANMNK